MLDNKLLKEVTEQLASKIKGEPGKDGRTPTEKELIALILSVLAKYKRELIFKGDKGDKGDKPIAGKDFNLPDEKAIIKGVLAKIKNPKDGYVPIKGKDYFDGEKGEPGWTPRHEIKDNKLRFEIEKGKWGKWIDFQKLLEPIASRYAAILRAKMAKRRPFTPVGTRIATQAEVDAGTEDNKIVTPETLANYSRLGSGDMAKATYDPNSVEGDAFDQDNMVDGTTNKNYTATEQTKLSGIEESADVTDAANVAAAGALMDSEVTNLADVKAFDPADYAAALGGDDNYVTDAEKTVIGNTSGTNSGDEVVATGAEVNTGTNDTKMVTPKAIADSKVSITDGAETLTNKRITARVKTFSSDATPDIDSDDYDAVTITAQAAAITDINVTGTPTNFQKLIFRIKDNGTARAITWGSDFEAKGVALPTTTTASKVLTVGFIYDTVTSKWGCVASVEEA